MFVLILMLMRGPIPPSQISLCPQFIIVVPTLYVKSRNNIVFLYAFKLKVQNYVYYYKYIWGPSIWLGGGAIYVLENMGPCAGESKRMTADVMMIIMLVVMMVLKLDFFLPEEEQFLTHLIDYIDCR